MRLSLAWLTGPRNTATAEGHSMPMGLQAQVAPVVAIRYRSLEMSTAINVPGFVLLFSTQ